MSPSPVQLAITPRFLSYEKGTGPWEAAIILSNCVRMLKFPRLKPDSAVSEFWKTFKVSPRSGGAPRAPRRKTSNNLPAELLLIIFRLVHEQEIVDRSRHDSCRHDSPALFPYAIAAVCLLWRDVMTEFWTYVVILVDSTLVPSTSVILSHVSLSGNLPLEVTISRANFDRRAVDVEHERTQVMSIMSVVIYPCMHRLRDLRFDVVFSSSLPPFPHAFPANTPQHLHLLCKEDNGSSRYVWESVTPPASEQQYSSLWTLCLDGRNYYDNCRMTFWQKAKFMSLKTFDIVNYTPLPGHSFASSDFLLPLTTLNINMLLIRNVTLIPVPSQLPILSQSCLFELELTDIHNFETIAVILRALGHIRRLIFRRCVIGHPRVLFGPGDRFSHRPSPEESISRASFSSSPPPI